MLRMKIEDLIFEVREELICYDEIGVEGADNWEKGFRSWLEKDGKKVNVIEQKGKKYYSLEDESEIFAIADEYLEAIESNSVENYWKSFQ